MDIGLSLVLLLVHMAERDSYPLELLFYSSISCLPPSEGPTCPAPLPSKWGYETSINNAKTMHLISGLIKKRGRFACNTFPHPLAEQRELQGFKAG